MVDVLFLVGMGLLVYVVARVILKEPILPWKEKSDKVDYAIPGVKKRKQKREGSPLDELEAAPFRELFGHVRGFENHMIRHNDNTFTMLAEVDPVNYFLLDQEEQEAIDAIFETWLAQLNYRIRIYLQNRFIDLTEPIQDIQQVMDDQDDLHSMAKQFGQNMINNLKSWQRSQPRYETKRYIVFDYKVEVKDIRADGADELEEKIVDKAFNELYRRVNTAKSQLRKADIGVDLLTTDGIAEVLYYGFNRRKAIKNRYRDVENQEQLALFITADQTPSRIARVKGEMEDVQSEEKTTLAG